MICVAIPYLQRQPGVLRKALLSVAAQQGGTQRVQVLMVDDASPVPQEREPARFDWPAGMAARVIQQTTAGPGGARNTGLDAVPEECTLERAVAALEQGFDFFQQANATHSANLDHNCQR
jgi:succinoglycan biosynthesis protein ExoW